MSILRLFLLMPLLAFSTLVYPASLPNTPSSFTQSKKIASKIYNDHGVTFYCGCKYSKNKQVDLKSCSYVPRKNKKRASRVEWEHIMPAENFGRSRVCWRENICKKKNGKRYKGRACCNKIDPEFRKMQADLMNLVPAIGEVNGDRSNFRYGMVGGEPYQYGKCPVITDFKGRRFQPAEYSRGFIARTYFYMSKTYGIHIGEQQRRLFESWDKMYPPAHWEIRRNKRIAVIQDHTNYSQGKKKYATR